MDLRGKRVVVVGLGKSGLAAYGLLKEMGAEICLYDGKEDLDTSAYGAPVWLGALPDEVLRDLDCAVFSPGVPTDIPVAKELGARGIPIIGEIELAFLYERGRVIAITGTNGKTTTTTLVGEIMKASGGQTFVVGNIGNPYTKEVLGSTEESVTVAEISSFQLETVDTFHPSVSAILNITPDHLDRHGSMENYIDAKLGIARNQTGRELCVLNYGDEVLRARAGTLPCRTAFFSSREKLDEGLYQDGDGNIVDGATGEILMNMSECRLPGDHNCENIMAAVLMTREMGVPMDVILQSVKGFRPVEHRVEFVRTAAGVDYYNDSKGTNPDAAIKGIQSMGRPTVLIGGGYDKGGEFDGWIRAFGGRVKKLLLLGATRERIARTADELGFHDYEYVGSLEEAVTRAAELAEDGDAVLLSPACASWDMFASYEQRGNMFKEYVRKL